MKFIITENKLEKLAIHWLNQNYSPDQLEIVESSFFYKNGKLIMIIGEDNDNIYFNYHEIWSFLEKIFNMNYKQIERVLKQWLEETFKLKGYTPNDFLPQD